MPTIETGDPQWLKSWQPSTLQYSLPIRNNDAELHLINRAVSKLNQLRHRNGEVDRKDLEAIEDDLRIVRSLLKGEAPKE